MASVKFNTKSPTIRRILKEAQELAGAPSRDYTAAPLESDLFEWHFTLKGPPNSVYSEGIYHGRIVLPPAYPLRPPSFRFMTPSGRFEANREICLSISGHHEETWQPAWGVRTALVALRSFMETDAKGQLGGLDTTDQVRKQLATESLTYLCPACGKSNREIIKECQERVESGAVTPDVDVEVPSELTMGWKDEMGRRASDLAPKTSHKNQPQNQCHSSSGRPVDTTLRHPRSSDYATDSSSSPQVDTRDPGARMIMVNRPGPSYVPGVPRWLDQLILLLFVILAAALIHRFTATAPVQI